MSLILHQCAASKIALSLVPAPKNPHGIRNSHPHIPLGWQTTVYILQGTHANRSQMCSSCISQLDPHLYLCNPIKRLTGLYRSNCLLLNKILTIHKQKQKQYLLLCCDSKGLRKLKSFESISKAEVGIMCFSTQEIRPAFT